MKKLNRLIALLLTLVMILGMLPSAAFGATLVDGTPIDKALVLSKSYNDGVLTLESYAAGTTSINTTSTTKACDIVLVLDVSGSMGNEEVTIGTGYVPYRSRFSAASVNYSDYYYKDGDGEDDYYQVKAIYDNGNFIEGTLLFNRTWLYYEKNGVRYYLSGNQVIQAKSPIENPSWNNPPHDVSGNPIPGVVNWPLLLMPLINYTVWTGTLYRIGSEREVKLDALKIAVDGFIDSVAANAAENNVEHRISIVKFAGEYPNRQSESSLTEGNNSGKTEVVKNLTSVLVDPNGGETAYDKVNSLHDAVSKLEANGATYADYGMTKAGFVLDPDTNNKARSDSQKVVLLFTDGEPNHGNGFDTRVANTTISKSYNLKHNEGVKVYSVGIYDNPSTDMTNYMNYVSSNYPDAWSMSITGFRAASSYYRRATTASDLNNIFAAIASEAVISTDSLVGHSYITFDSAPVMCDEISKYFMLPDNYSVGLKAYYVEQTSCINGKPIFGTDRTYLPVSDIDIVVDGKKVMVNNFEYDKYYVTTDNTSSGMNGNHVLGRKLIVEIPIVPDFSVAIPDELVDPDNDICKVPTNAVTSGIYDGDVVERFISPVVEFSTYKIVHCGSTTDESKHISERYIVPNGTIDLTKVVNEGVLYGGTFTDSKCTEPASEDATKFTPEAGKTYYMWEVSPEHLMPKNLCAYRSDGNGGYYVEKAYLVTAVDRDAYKNVGFAVSANAGLATLSPDDISANAASGTVVDIIDEQQLFDKVQVSQPGREDKPEFTYGQLYGTSTTGSSLFACANLIDIHDKPFYSYTDADTNAFYFRAFWTTYDGVTVLGSTTRKATYQKADGKSLNAWDNNEKIQYIKYAVDPVKPETPAPMSVASVFDYDSTYESFLTTVPLMSLLPAPDEEPEIPVEPADYVEVSDNGKTYKAMILNGAVTLEPAGASGKLFAGWYLDEKFTKAADLTSVKDGDAIYAKYISDAYLNVKYTDSILLKRLSLISAIDARDYAKTGFIVEIGGEKKVINVSSYTNSYLLVSAKTLFGSSIAKNSPLMTCDLSLSGVKKNSTIKITPFAITKDGTEILGEERTLVYTGFSIKG